MSQKSLLSDEHGKDSSISNPFEPGYFVNVLVCENCSFSSFNLEQFNFIFLDIANQVQEKYDFSFFIKEYFKAKSFSEPLKCSSCRQAAIKRIHKFIYKFPKNILITFNDFRALMQDSGTAMKMFKGFRKFDLSQYYFLRKEFRENDANINFPNTNSRSFFHSQYPSSSNDKKKHEYRLVATINYDEIEDQYFRHFYS